MKEVAGRLPPWRFLRRVVVCLIGCGLVGLVACSALWGFEDPLAPGDGGQNGLDDSHTEGAKGSDSGTRTASCVGLAEMCGPTGNSDCCESKVVPSGTYDRSNDTTYPATVSAFQIDTYEVTVGRFRAFVARYPDDLPSAGAGKNPNNAADPGWQASWASAMPLSQATLTASFNEWSTYGCGGAPANTRVTWTDVAGDNENKAMNCITWFEAFAFCTWDGGRLPTEAEWNYVAAGGNEQRAYPWSNPPSSTTIDTTYAVFNPEGGSGVAPAAVGSRSPRGNGKWGQVDLAGNVWEWVVDGPAAYAIPCKDCADLLLDASVRGYRGGSVTSPSSYLLTSYRINNGPLIRSSDLGARCARAP